LLHALLLGAVVLAGCPAALKLAGVAAIVVHALLRSPAKSPGLILVEEGGACAVPEWQTGMRPLGPRTMVAPFWIRLDLGACLPQRELLLIADQVGPEDWRRLRAVLARGRGA
jgi:hypothetical protein